MIQIYLKPSCRKMIMRAAHPTKNAINKVIVTGATCNPISYDVRGNAPEHAGIPVYSAKAFALKGYSLKSNLELENGNIHRI